MKNTFFSKLVIASVVLFHAQAALAVTIERYNVNNGGGVYVPAIVITGGDHAGTVKIGEQGLTREIYYDAAALAAWAAGVAGVPAGEINLYVRAYPSPPPAVTEETPKEDVPKEKCYTPGSATKDITLDQLMLVNFDDCDFIPCYETDASANMLPQGDLPVLAVGTKCIPWIVINPNSKSL